VTEWIVAPTGLDTNAGTLVSPWSLATALAGASGSILSNDTVWLRGGTYNRTDQNWVCSVSGVVGAGADLRDGKVVFSNYSGEHAIIQETNSGTTPTAIDNLLMECSFVWMWGLDIGCVVSNRTHYVTGPSCVWMISTPDIGFDTDGNKILHCNLHDPGGNGIFFNANTGRCEAYGNLSYNAGYSQPPGGHGFYGKHKGTKVLTMEGNISFNHNGFGTQLFSVTGANDFTEYIDYLNSILFNAGACNNTASLGGKDAVTLEFGPQSQTMSNLNIANNWAYSPSSIGDRHLNLGQGRTGWIGAAVSSPCRPS